MRSIILAVVAPAVLLGIGCGGQAASPAPRAPDAPQTKAPPSAGATDGLAPIPYTAAQIRDACRPGHTLVFRVESAGKPTLKRTFKFLASTADGTENEVSVEDESGAAVGAAKRVEARWEELRQHAAFPRERTTITQERVTTPAGAFDAAVYTVRGEGDEVNRFYFARNLPGPPVLFFTERAGARVMTSTLVSFVP